MSRVPYTNTSKAGHYIGNVFVPAGGTRTVDGRLLAPKTAAPAPAGDDPMKKLASGPVKALVDALPTLDAAACDALLAFEREKEKPRTTAIEAIELRKLEILDAEEQARQAAEAEEAARAAAAAAGEGGDAAGDDAGNGQGAGGE